MALQTPTEQEWGLVLCGGGAKGSYQIGAWKALLEYGFFDKFTGISGDSIGAINALMMASMSVSQAEDIWGNINFLTVFDTEPELIDMVEGTFSRNEMLELMRERVDYGKVAASPLSLHVNVTRIGTDMEDQQRFPVYETLNNKSQEQIEKLIMASSALPVIYEAVEIDGFYYRDGGLTDNMPIKPLYDQGYRRIMIVALSHTAALNTDLFPDCELVLIRPSADLGDMLSGTLNFKKRDLAVRQNLGYRDTLRTLKSHFEEEIPEGQKGALEAVDYHDIVRTARQDELMDGVNAHLDKLNELYNRYDI